MKQNAIVAGVGMTSFGKHLERSLSSLATEAIMEALADAGLPIERLQAVWAGNAGAGIVTGQTCVAGQAILRNLGIGRVPVTNVENACATASTAFQQACTMVTLGAFDAALAFGVEKLYHADPQRPMLVYSGCTDTEHPERLDAYLADDSSSCAPADGPSARRSIFMDIYARMARDYMAATGAAPRHFAKISAKNSQHGCLNPRAQFREQLTESQVLAARLISNPLTLPMCSPIGDGAAAAIIVSPRVARELGLAQPVHVLCSLLGSGFDAAPGAPGLVEAIAAEAYTVSGVSPGDLDCVELHDATSPAELINYEALGLCAAGDGPSLLESGATTLGGRVPVNPSGGLVRKGHPIGATGLAQIYELVQQLRGRADRRQIDGAKLALAENGGGFIGADVAAVTMTVLSR